jgi:hypothetical protein
MLMISLFEIYWFYADILGRDYTSDKYIKIYRDMAITLGIIGAIGASFYLVVYSWKIIRGDYIQIDEVGILDNISRNYRGRISWDDMTQVILKGSPGKYCHFKILFKDNYTAEKYGIRKNPKFILFVNISPTDKTHIKENYNKIKVSDKT